MLKNQETCDQIYEDTKHEKAQGDLGKVDFILWIPILIMKFSFTLC